MTATLTNTPTPNSRHDLFTRVSGWTIRITGGRWAFLTAFGVVIVWAASGPFFHYSENWQLIINTGTTIVTFLMVFLIQGAQNRESKAIHLKLDELIMGVNRARNELVNIETLTDEQLEALSGRYREVAQQYQHKLTECFPAEVCDELPVDKNNRETHMTVK
ncbi:Low affinity Fe/Cu permease [Singulisphaera sp. GP187]|nr:Low affinity Fe/Cu permease [Singulisphaera sp. GP187]